MIVTDRIHKNIYVEMNAEIRSQWVRSKRLSANELKGFTGHFYWFFKLHYIYCYIDFTL